MCAPADGGSWASDADLERARLSWRRALAEGAVEARGSARVAAWQGGKDCRFQSSANTETCSCIVTDLRASVVALSRTLGTDDGEHFAGTATYNLECDTDSRIGRLVEKTHHVIRCESMEGYAQNGAGDLMWVAYPAERCKIRETVDRSPKLPISPVPPAGAIDGPCYQNETCNGGLGCKGGICVPVGVEGGLCRTLSLPPTPKVELGFELPPPPPPPIPPCDPGLYCKNGYCQQPGEGEVSGNCYGNGTCNRGLICMGGTCVPH